MPVPPVVQRLLPVAVAVLLVAGVVGLAVVDEPARPGSGTTLNVSPDSTAPGETTTTSATPGDEPLVAPEMAELVADLQAFVEQRRGLKFTGPVRVTLLDDDDFKKRLDEESKIDKAEVEKTYKILVALDLIDEDVDLEKAYRALLGGAVLGYYDLEKKALFVRGSKATPAVRRTLVHELVHAIQDQNFNVHRPELGDRDDESEQSFTGLVEGDAVRIEEMYVATMSRRDQRAAEREQQSMLGDLSDVPPILLEALGFPYTVGPPFTQAVFRAGGQPRLDEAFRNPPTTSEQLIHPEKYLAGEGPADVAAPTAEGEVIDKGVFGELGFIQQLQEVITDRTSLFRAAAGWGGDHYIAYEAGDKTCVRVDVVMDTPTDADELRAALQRWVEQHDDASVTGDPGQPLRFTSCA